MATEKSLRSRINVLLLDNYIYAYIYIYISFVDILIYKRKKIKNKKKEKIIGLSITTKFVLLLRYENIS